MSKTDLRVIKTKLAIRDAFLRLIGTRDLSSITVQNILDEALINRKTFYKYYRDKYDLAETIAEGYLSRFDTLLSEQLEANGDSLIAFIGGMYEEMYRNDDKVRAIWSIRTNRINVIDEMDRKLRRIYQSSADRYGAKGDIEVQSGMFSAFFLRFYEYIMDEKRPCDVEMILSEYRNLYDILAASERSGI